MTSITKSVLRNFAIIQVLPFLNNHKDLDPSYKMDLDFWDCLEGKKTVFDPRNTVRIQQNTVSQKSVHCHKKQLNQKTQCKIHAAETHVNTYDTRKAIYFIPSSEFKAYLKQLKVLLSVVKKYCIFSLVTNTIYIFPL